MKIKIIKGTNQIGGCITEITSTNGTKILIDFGEDLIEAEPIKIKGLTYGTSNYDAVFITHSHKDHIGLIHKIKEDIPIFMEESTKKIHNISSDFMKGTKPRKQIIKKIVFEKQITINDLKITPYLVDHSAYHSCMYLIEGEKKVLHMGDYRNHGRKGAEFIKTLQKIGTIDLLITEGTTFGRNNSQCKTEDDLLKEANTIFETYKQVLILQSSTNIDRLVTFYKASNHTKKYFIEDLFTATIASNLKKTIPSPVTHQNVSVWISNKYKRKPEEFQKTYIEPMKPYQKNKPLHHDFCMIVKPSMAKEIKEKLYDKNLLQNACLIYSMWDGYLKEDTFKTFLEEIKNMKIPIFKLHTSGHADKKAMKQVNSLLKPKKTILIHTEHKEMANEIFETVKLEDGEEFYL